MAEVEEGGGRQTERARCSWQKKGVSKVSVRSCACSGTRAPQTKVDRDTDHSAFGTTTPFNVSAVNPERSQVITNFPGVPSNMTSPLPTTLDYLRYLPPASQPRHITSLTHCQQQPRRFSQQVYKTPGHSIALHQQQHFDTHHIPTSS